MVSQGRPASRRVNCRRFTAANLPHLASHGAARRLVCVEPSRAHSCPRRPRSPRKMTKSAKDVLALAKDRGAVIVDLKFMDFVGLWQHFTIPLNELSEGVFEE